MCCVLLVLIVTVPFHAVVSLPLDGYAGYIWNFRYAPGMLWHYDKCILDNTYSESTLPPMVRRSDYDKIIFQSREVVPNIRIHNQGPLSMQGVFWLDLPGSELVEVISFAQTKEGGGLSTGTLSDTGPAYRLRQIGDRIWASTGFPRFLADLPDNIVELWLLDGTTTDPKQFQMIVDFKLPGRCTRYKTNSCPTMQGNFTLQNTAFDDDDDFPSHDVYTTSVVWSRETTGFVEFDYEAIQIVDGEGNLLQPAYDAFIQAVDGSGGFLNAGELQPNPRFSVCKED